jgi:hypothetical protein
MVQLVFFGSQKSDTTETKLSAFCNIHNEIYISIDNGYYPAHIVLNKETAIKFSKELRKQIARIDNEKSI